MRKTVELIVQAEYNPDERWIAKVINKNDLTEWLLAKGDYVLMEELIEAIYHMCRKMWPGSLLEISECIVKYNNDCGMLKPMLQKRLDVYNDLNRNNQDCVIQTSQKSQISQISQEFMTSKRELEFLSNPIKQEYPLCIWVTDIPEDMFEITYNDYDKIKIEPNIEYEGKLIGKYISKKLDNKLDNKQEIIVTCEIYANHIHRLFLFDKKLEAMFTDEIQSDDDSSLDSY